MKSEELAARLLSRALADQQASHRLDAEDDPDAIRREVRRLARREDVRIRTGIVEDALVVVLADADLWTQSTSTMREKLRPTV